MSIKHLYIIITTKKLLIEWLLEINIFIGKKLSRANAVQEINQFIESNKKIDLRTVPASIKKRLIHDQDVLKMRWDLCSNCEFLKDNRCLKCGCFMKTKHKLGGDGISCPVGKWGEYHAD